MVTKKGCEGWVPGASCAVYPTGTNNHLQADDADISMVLITGITKFLPPAEVLISPLNLKGWHGVRQRAEAKGPGIQLNFKQAIACHDAFQNPNRVQNINIPRNLLFPYIICLLKKKKDWKKFLMCDYSDREWVPTALWMAFYLIPLVKTVN